jgi:riboflavin biosynthesis pyrimidine reductase
VLFAEGIGSLLVEGGAMILHSFIEDGLADQALVTVSPFALEGVAGPGIPAWAQSLRQTYGTDTVFWGINPSQR